MSKRPSVWSRQLVLDELRALDRAGRRTALADLTAAGLGTLAHAATVYAGGLRHARELAGIDPSPRRPGKKRWTKAAIVAAITKRAREDKSLASTLAPPALVTAGRWHFGSWREALDAAGIDARETQVSRKKYTRDVIIAKLREAARGGSDLRTANLAKIVKLEAVRREFGTVREALIAAGLGRQLERRKHGRLKWSRERLIEVLRERARRSEHTLTSGLHRVAQLYFGGADAARAAAGVPSPIDLRTEGSRPRTVRGRARRRTPTPSHRR